ncbi:variable surface protein [Plasmodium gonderi]|uniref:Variable surface protein n=1 Tax=Plasmodium gonderi TaxID=77519 RepID=A0A1Y1JQN3_PLAGO|nr:variable surface protein [Plasmodium gonderi]GAW84520.1 variable surface protein [Plasmodium gonderi]
MEDISDANEFNFQNIFPQCRYDINGIEYRELKNPWYNLCSPTCNDFQKRINVSSDVSFYFHKSCIILCMYLKHIQINKSSSHVKEKACCKYFYYKLKELIKNYRGTCTTTKECYEKMRIKENQGRMDIPNICVSHLYGIDDINDDTYEKFQYLQKLYDIEDKFNKTWVDCPTANKIINEYISYSEKNKNVNNNQSFREELNKVNVRYNAYRNKKSNCFPSRKPSHSSLESGKDTGAIIGTDTYTKSASFTDIEAYAAIHRGTSTVTGVSVLTITILMIIFFLYKYTSYGSFLQSIVRKLRRRMKKKYDNSLNIKDSFDKTYTNLNKSNYRIAYYSED